MKQQTYNLSGNVWVYPGHAAWHFVSVPPQDAQNIKKTFGAHARGFGSLPVLASTGTSTWRTSIFPDTKSGTYLLPLKKSIRTQEHIKSGDMLSYTITIPPR